MNARAFREQYQKYEKRLRCSMLGVMKNSEEAEDVVASAFASAFHKRREFRGESSFYTYLYRIAMNQAWTHWRQKRLVSLDDVMENSMSEALLEPDILEQTLDRSECCLKLRKALRKVPIAFRKTLVNHFVRGQRVRKIARQDRIPVGTVLSRIYKGKQILRRAWASAESASTY